MSELPSGTVTFLFTDIQDSTPLWEQHPAAMSRVLARHDELIEDLVQQHNGFPVRPRGEGDSRFIVFPRAIDSVIAASAIQKALHAEPWPEQIPLLVRMALHTGEGEFRSGDYYGTAVNRCARLRGLSHGGQTLISQSTYELVVDALHEDLSFKDLGEKHLKGLSRPEHVFQLIIPGLPTEFDHLETDMQRLSPSFFEIPMETPAFLDADLELGSKISEDPIFVAREYELDWLNNSLKTALEGKGRVVFIAGGPGRGKTALVDAFTRQAFQEHSSLLIAKGNCHAYSGVGDSYGPFREVMGMLTGDIETHWATGLITTKAARSSWDSLPVVIQAVLNHGPHLPGIFVDPKALLSRAVSSMGRDSALTKELDLALNHQPDSSTDLDQVYLFEQYTNVLLTLAKNRPLLLVLDDMQWTDTSSASLLFHLGRRLEGARILVVCAYRPAEVALGRSSLQLHSEKVERHPLEKVVSEFKRWFGEVYLDLGQIEDLEGRRFVDAFLDIEPNRLEESFRKALFNHTAGHPLFTIELLQAMKERGDLIQVDGSWVQGQSLDWKTLPAKVEGVVDERVNRLENDLHELLAVASVEGAVFTSQVLARVQQSNELQLLRQLKRELEDRHRLVKEHDEILVGENWLARYRFTHLIFQQHLYSNTSEGERRILHRSIGKVLEELYRGHEVEIAVQLAHHFTGDIEKEKYYATLAGEQAVRKFANNEALEYFTRALALTADDDFIGRYKLLISREAIYNLIGDRQAQKQDLLELKSLVANLDELDAGPGRSEVETRWANFTSHTDYQGTAILAENAVALAKSEGRLDVAVKAYIIWSNSLSIQGEHSTAVRQAEAGISLAQDIGDLRAESTLVNSLGVITLEQGDPRQARDFFERGLTIAHEIGDRKLEAQPLNNLGISTGLEGDYDAAQSYYEQALQLAREIGNRRGEGLVLGNLGWIAGIQGDFETAEFHYEKQGNIAREIGDRYQEAYVAINICTSILAQGDYENALKNAQKGFELARETGNPSGEAWAFTNMGHIYFEMGELEDGETAYQKALDIRRSLTQLNLAMEPLAGLARIALDRKEIPAAHKQVKEILQYLDGGGTLDGTEEPLRVLLTCYCVLQAIHDSRSVVVLENAYEQLNERANRILDDELRCKFLENISYHQEILKAWRTHKSLT
ncbi:tetratricopeptide repeat protein [Chloroflexota bacterium]